MILHSRAACQFQQPFCAFFTRCRRKNAANGSPAFSEMALSGRAKSDYSRRYIAAAVAMNLKTSAAPMRLKEISP
jgi:hypothetical protein